MRNQRLDVMKGIGIVMVVLCHAIINGKTGDNVYNNGLADTIYSFFMLMFFIISGYLSYGKVGNWNWTKRHILKWLLPVFAFAIIYWLIAQVLPGSNFYELYRINFINYIMGIISTGFNGLVLWYLWVMIFCYIGAYILEQSRLKNKIPLILQSFILILVINILPFDILGFTVVKWYIIFFLLGYVLCHYSISGKWAYISLVVFPLGAYLTNWMVDYQNVQYGFLGLARLIPAVVNGYGLLIVVMFVMGISGTAFIYSLARLIKWQPFVKILSYLGSISIGIYLIHIIFVGIVSNYWMATLLATIISVGLYEVLKRSAYINFLLFGGNIPIKLKVLGGWYAKTQA